jgi:hypothetical protein
MVFAYNPFKELIMFGFTIGGIGLMFWIPYIIICLIIAAIANGKGRSFWGFFFISLLLCPLIGILCVIFVPRIEDETGLKRCIHCDELIRQEASICKHCKSEVPIELVNVVDTYVDNEIGISDEDYQKEMERLKNY